MTPMNAMFERLLRAGRTLLRRALSNPGLDVTRWHPPADPVDLAGVRVPKRTGPGGRHTAVALAEPDDPQDIHAIGVSRNRTQTH